jgi:nucleotide-binding universal stress UspA family protein
MRNPRRAGPALSRSPPSPSAALTTPQKKGPNVLPDVTHPRSNVDEPSAVRDFDRRGKLIVVGYDDSPQARQAVELAAQRAGPGGTVLAVYVLPRPPSHLGTPHYQRTVEGDHRRGRQLLRRLVEELPGARIETELCPGKPEEALARIARQRHADEVLIGSRGLGRWRSLVRRSVSRELLRLADRPVLVVPYRAVDRRRHGSGVSAPGISPSPYGTRW